MQRVTDPHLVPAQQHRHTRLTNIAALVPERGSVAMVRWPPRIITGAVDRGEGREIEVPKRTCVGLARVEECMPETTSAPRRQHRRFTELEHPRNRQILGNEGRLERGIVVRQRQTS